MSEDLSAIHAQTSAIFEKLYDHFGSTRGVGLIFPPRIQYFKLVDEQFKVDHGPVERAVRGPHTTDAKLSKIDKGLIEVNVPSKSEKFLVSKLQSGE